jgi:hypothetical protein
VGFKHQILGLQVDWYTTVLPSVSMFEISSYLRGLIGVDQAVAAVAAAVAGNIWGNAKT